MGGIFHGTGVKAKAFTSPKMTALSSLKRDISSALQNAIAFIVKNESNKYYLFGEFDRLPNEIIEAVNNSGTATACVNRLRQFIQADGFIQEGMNEVRANKRQTLFQVLGESATNISYLQGMALRLIWNNEGTKIKKVFSVPVQTLRRQGDKFRYNPLMGEQGKNESETVRIPEFDPERQPRSRIQMIADQIKNHGEQLGEILYVFKKGMGRYYDIYPVPDYYSSIEDIISDGKISQLELRNIQNGWRTPIIISSGPVDDINEDEDGRTEQDYWDAAINQFVGENASPVLHLKGKTDEQKPQITTINIAEILDQTEKSTDRLARKVARLMGVPEILVGISTAGKLGNSQELVNMMKLFALSVYEKQQLITEAFQQVEEFLDLEGLATMPRPIDWTISTLQLFDDLPKEVIDRLADEEVKEIFQISSDADNNQSGPDGTEPSTVQP
jgi:hypothetical protein